MYFFQEQKSIQTYEFIERLIKIQDIASIRLNLLYLKNIRECKKSDANQTTTLLHCAVQSNNVEIVNSLLSLSLINNKELIDCFDIYGRTALAYAAEQGSEHIVAALLNAGANVNARGARIIPANYGGPKNIGMDDLDGDITALHCAANNGDIKMMQLLLSSGAQINALLIAKDLPGMHPYNSIPTSTALDIVIKKQFIDAVPFLKQHGAKTALQLNNIPSQLEQPQCFIM